MEGKQTPPPSPGGYQPPMGTPPPPSSASSYLVPPTGGGNSSDGFGNSSASKTEELIPGGDKYMFYAGSYLMGIPIYIHALLPAVIVMQMIAYGIAGGGTGFFLGLLVGLVLFLTVLIHEYGHAWATIHYGGHCEKIVLWPLGGLAFCAHSRGHREDMMIALAGPFTHLPQFLVWLILQAITTQKIIVGIDGQHVGEMSHLWQNLCGAAMYYQVSLWLFNCMPSYPLDGGRVLASWLMMRGHEANRAATISCYVAFPCALGVMIYGIMGFFQGGGSVLTLFVGAWVFMQVYQLWNLANSGQAETHPLFAPAPDGYGAQGGMDSMGGGGSGSGMA